MLKGKTAVVTGGSRGIGEAIVYELASMGANVAVIYAGSRAATERVCEKCKQEYSVGSKKLINAMLLIFLRQRKPLQRLKLSLVQHKFINNAGITRDGLLAMMKEEDFDSVLDTNLKGAFNMIRHMTGLFIRAREGCIINMASVAGIMGNAGQCKLLCFESRSYWTYKVCGKGACAEGHPL